MRDAGHVAQGGEDLAGLVAMGLVSGAGQFLVILPFRYASAATLGPVQYFSIVGGVLVGYFWFAEMPGWTTIIGALIVMSAMGLVLPRRSAEAVPGVSAPDTVA